MYSNIDDTNKMQMKAINSKLEVPKCHEKY